MKLDSHKRHIAKAITWRIVGTLDTILIGWLISGSFDTGISVAFSEILTKMVLYYLHERIWFNLRIFRKDQSRIRHILKTITWRFIGTSDTILLGWLITGKAEIGITIGGMELLTKTVLYYMHERIWYRSNYGLERTKKLNLQGDEESA